VANKTWIRTGYWIYSRLRDGHHHRLQSPVHLHSSWYLLRRSFFWIYSRLRDGHHHRLQSLVHLHSSWYLLRRSFFWIYSRLRDGHHHRLQSLVHLHSSWYLLRRSFFCGSFYSDLQADSLVCVFFLQRSSVLWIGPPSICGSFFRSLLGLWKLASRRPNRKHSLPAYDCLLPILGN
jgi:hypothetical protein